MVSEILGTLDSNPWIPILHKGPNSHNASSHLKIRPYRINHHDLLIMPYLRPNFFCGFTSLIKFFFNHRLVRKNHRPLDTAFWYVGLKPNQWNPPILWPMAEDVPPVMFRHFESAMDVRILKRGWIIDMEMMMVNQCYLVDILD